MGKLRPYKAKRFLTIATYNATHIESDRNLACGFWPCHAALRPTRLSSAGVDHAAAQT